MTPPIRIFFALALTLFIVGAAFSPYQAEAKGTKALVALPDSTDGVISGYVKDSASGETIIGATIRVRGTKRGAVTNKSGYFALYAPSGKEIIIDVSSVGYTPTSRTFTLANDEKKNITILISEAKVQGQEIVVQTDKEKELREATQVSRVNIQPAQVEYIPQAGEADLFRILQLIPGVQTISEISAGLYVRGGSPDQNLILLDGATLYNPSHFFGFFSTFNSDAIKDVDLIKGGYPAQYGGRLSAVLNVTNKDGDLYRTKGMVSLGLISSRASVETPIGDGALTLSGRRTYIDYILKVSGLQKSLELPDYYFYDLNGKFTQSLGEKDKIFVSGYGGKDKLTFENGGAASSVDIDWGNRAGTAAWTHLFNEKLFSKFSFNTSYYYSLLQFGLGTNSFTFDNQINDYSLKGDFEYFSGDNNLIKAGFQVSKYDFGLKIYQADNPPNANVKVDPFYLAGYISNEWKPDERWAVTTGLRVDGITSNGDIGIDPRVSARYILNEDVTIKGSWGIYHQYLKLASNPLFTAFDIWLPVDSTQSASRADQYVLGVSTAPFEGFTLDVEAYYKNMTNLVELKPNIVVGNTLSDIFFVGDGYSYGIEFFLQKQIGDLTGWFGYTLAYNRRRFPDINNGTTFPPVYDRRNDLNLVLTYKLSDRWTIGSTFVYATGQSYSQTTALYNAGEPDYDGKLITVQGSKNGLRLEPYHRLDVAASYAFSLFSDERNATLNIDVYNIYNHRNVWFRRVDTEQDPPIIEDVRLLPVLPTFSIQVKF
jgi:outer membrane cobalamin receptor